MQAPFLSLRTGRRVLRSAALLSLLAAASCQSSARHEVPAAATPVTETSLAAGVTNLSHSGDTYFGGYPTADGLRALHARGVKRVISLKTNDEVMKAKSFDEAALARELGIELVVIPVSASSFSRADLERFAAAYDKSADGQSKGPVLVHCGSSNTVGGVWAAYLHRYRGVDRRDAFALGKAAGLRSAEMRKAAEFVMEAGQDASDSKGDRTGSPQGTRTEAK